MTPTQQNHVADTISKTIAQFGIELDSIQAAQKKRQRARVLNVVQIPLFRFIGLVLAALAVFLHNRFILTWSSNTEALTYFILALFYALASWGILYFFFEKVKFVHLGDFFLSADLILFALAIYFSGGEKSYLFPIIVVRVLDQTSTSLKRVIIFAGAGVFTYTVLMLYLNLVEHHIISWPAEFAKLCFLLSADSPAIMTTKMVERLRSKVSGAVHISKEFITQLQTQTTELENARANLEKLYLREQEVNHTLKELNQMKTNFLIVTSHEMRTPLTIIKGYNEALLSQFFGTLSENQKRSLEATQRVVDRLSMTLEDILEMLKIAEGHIQLKLQSFNLTLLVQQVMEEFAPFINKRQQQICLHAPEELHISADHEKIHLALLNIIQNAIKFTHDNGEIQIHITPHPEQIHIRIQDNGIGIENSEIERIFDKFYTNEDPAYHTSGKFQFMARGTGLGLSIAKSYVEAHSGKIWAESDGKGKGSCFYMTLPYQPRVSSANGSGSITV